MDHFHAVILAGGSGTRLWPLSTPSSPKQFLPLPGGRSMIQETLARVAPLIAPESAWVVTNRALTELVHQHVPSVPVSHILGEPMGRSTSAAIGWAAATIVRQDRQAIMASFHADHAIAHVDALRRALRLAYELAQQEYLVTLGIKPTAAKPGMDIFALLRYRMRGMDIKHTGPSGLWKSQIWQLRRATWPMVTMSGIAACLSGKWRRSWLNCTRIFLNWHKNWI